MKKEYKFNTENQNVVIGMGQDPVFENKLERLEQHGVVVVDGDLHDRAGKLHAGRAYDDDDMIDSKKIFEPEPLPTRPIKEKVKKSEKMKRQAFRQAGLSGVPHEEVRVI